MDEILSFVILFLVQLLDPLTLAIAAVFGAIAAYRDRNLARWLVVFAGAAAIIVVGAFLTSLAPRGRYHWGPYAIAHVLQVALLMWVILIWRRDRERKRQRAAS